MASFRFLFWYFEEEAEEDYENQSVVPVSLPLYDSGAACILIGLLQFDSTITSKARGLLINASNRTELISVKTCL
jgi:hypothetical protein